MTPLATLSWRKSAHSGAQGGECVELATLQRRLVTGDTKHHARLALVLNPHSLRDTLR